MLPPLAQGMLPPLAPHGTAFQTYRQNPRESAKCKSSSVSGDSPKNPFPDDPAWPMEVAYLRNCTPWQRVNGLNA